MLYDALQYVLSNYLSARAETFAKHPIANFLRDALPAELEAVIKVEAPFMVRGSAGKGKWANCPGVAVLDTRITRSTQYGYYVVYLFAEDMSKVYLSLNQGVTAIRESIGDRLARPFLVDRAEYLGQQLNRAKGTGRQFGPIDLGSHSKNSLTSFYELAAIKSIKYEKDNIPPQKQLIDDLNELLADYLALDASAIQLEQDLADQSGLPAKTFEDYRKVVQHLRVDRRSTDKVKQLKGYTCEACDLVMKDVYGFEYIEAHHLRPISELKGQVVELDRVKDFAVLCPNCHVAVHKSGDPGNIAALRASIKQRN